MGRAALDAELIKRGYLWSLSLLAIVWGLMCVYFVWLGVEVDWLFVSIMILQTLGGMTINAAFMMAEYLDRRQALAGRGETQALLP